MLFRIVALALCLLAQPVSADLGQLIAKLTAFASDAADSVSAPASAAEHALYTPPPLEHVEEDEDADSVIGRQLSATEAKKPKRKFCNTTVYALKGDYAYEACGSFCKQAKATNHCKFCKCKACTFCPAKAGSAGSSSPSATAASSASGKKALKKSLKKQAKAAVGGGKKGKKKAIKKAKRMARSA